MPDPANPPAKNEAVVRATWRMIAAREALRCARDMAARLAGEMDTAAQMMDEAAQILQPALFAAPDDDEDLDDDE